MPVAFTQEVISNQWTAASMRNIITNKMVGLGYLSEGVSGDDLFFSFDLPTAAPKDKGYIRLNITNSTATNIKIQQWFSDSYTSNNLINPTSSFTDSVGGAAIIGYSSNESFPIKFCTFKSSEIALLSLIRNDNFSGLATIGFIFPSIKATWWDNNAIYGFCGTDPTMTNLRSYGVNPMQPTYVELNLSSNLPRLINPGGSRDLIRRILLIANNVGYVVGATTTDLGILGADGLTPLTQSQDNNQTWVNIRGGSSLAIRIL